MKIGLKIHYGYYSALTFVNTNKEDIILFYLDNAIMTNCDINEKRFKKFLSLLLFYQAPF